jgi:hypothetical protein
MLNLISIYGLDDYFVYLSISFVYEMKCVVVPFYPCLIDVALCIFTFATLSCHMITLVLLGTPHFAKLYN